MMDRLNQGQLDHKLTLVSAPADPAVDQFVDCHDKTFTTGSNFPAIYASPRRSLILSYSLLQGEPYVFCLFNLIEAMEKANLVVASSPKTTDSRLHTLSSYQISI
jgi:hypothetical protein